MTADLDGVASRAATPGAVRWPLPDDVAPDGRFAVIRTFISYGTRRRVLAGLAHRRSDDVEVRSAAEADIILALVTDWNLVDVAGDIAPLTVEGVESIDARQLDAVFSACVDRYVEGTTTDPKRGTSSINSPRA